MTRLSFRRLIRSLPAIALSMLLLPLAASAYDGTAAPISRTEGGGSVVAITAGEYHSCALTTDGSVNCWGDDRFGQATDQTGPYVSVSAGAFHSCGLKADGSVGCWGLDNSGQATDQAGPYLSVSAGDYYNCGLKLDGAVDCWGNNNFGQATDQAGPYLSVSAGDYHSCGLKADGGVDCWGLNNYGQATDQVGPYLSISAGKDHTCGLKTDGAVDCWGDNYFGQATDQVGPYLSISASSGHSCGLKVDGAVDCWGHNELGNATDQVGPYLSVSAGAGHTCGVKSDGAVGCWGAGAPGTSGTVHYGQSTVPAAMSTAGSTAFGQIAAGNAHACDVKRDGTLRCWGDNTSGQAAPPLGEFAQVVAGDVVSCAIDSDGKGTCWGQNSHTYNLQLVSGTKQQLTLSPINAMCSLSADGDALVRCVNASGNTSAYIGLKFRSIAHGSGSSTALCGVSLTQPGQGYCSSTGFDAGHAGYFAGPWQRLESGLSHQCGLKTDGTLACWGDNTEGQTDNVPSGQVRAFSVGYNHACAIRGDGTLACWGSNLSRQTDAPVGTYVQVAAGNTFTCAIRSDGQRVCWGAAPGNPARLSGLPNGVLGRAYSQQIAIFGPNAPANPTFAHMGGTLPPGLTLSSSGVLSGTPTTLGSFTLTLEAEGDGDFVATRTYTVTISDGTPPVIGYAFDPPAPDGSNGWYVSDVDVDWTVTDPESAISSSTGCNDTTLSTDAAGASWTCSATSAGGTSSKTTATIKRDATPPTITAVATTAPDGNNGWYVSPVTVSFTCNDALSGIASCPADQVLSSDGNPVSSSAQTATDNAGNASAPSNVIAVKIDRTAPTLNPIVPDPILRDGSYAIDPNASDATSGIASSSCGPLDTSTMGSKSVDCSATDNAGNGNTVTVNYTVSTTCANDGYTGTKLTWCRNICESGYTGSTLNTWLRRWIDRYRDLPYCRLEF